MTALLTQEPYYIAFLDIETTPNLGWTWGKYEQNVLDFEEEWYILSFAIKWAGSRTTEVYALPDFETYKTDPKNDKELVVKLWEVLNKADLVVAHNGDRFDVKKINTRIFLHKLPPPQSYKTVDTLKIARKNFAFNSNKLDDLGKTSGEGRKMHTGGKELWFGCMQGDERSWVRMKKYNKQDVILLEKIYNRFRGWHVSHPNINAKEPTVSMKCPVCGGTHINFRGWRRTLSYKIKRFQCMNCGHLRDSTIRVKIPGEGLR